MRRASLFTKIFLGYAAITFFLLIFIYLFFSNLLETHNLEMVSAQLEKIARSLEPEIKRQLVRKNPKKINNFINRMGRTLSVRITVILPDGKVLGDSEENPSKMDNHKGRPEVSRAIRGFPGRSIRYSRTVERKMVYLALPILSGNRKVIGVLRTSIYLTEITTLLYRLKKDILAIFGVIILITVSISLLISRTLSKPIRKFIAASKSVALGNFRTKIDIRNRDEFTELAHTFNMMTRKINDLFRILTTEEEKIQTIISSIQEGIVAFDNEGKIKLLNKGFQQIIKKEESVIDKFLWEVFRHNKFYEFVKKFMISGKKNDQIEIEIGSDFFLSSITFIRKKKEYVVLFHNISKIRKLESIKKDFVTNVSHELRTPLTAIKGFSETLLALENEKKKKHYLDIILRHTDRLILIVKDLLSLSKLESGEIALQKEKINLKTLLGNILDLFHKAMRKKNIKLKLKIEKNLPVISGDISKLEQLFINLIDNAIKYTEKGKIHIEIYQKASILTGLGNTKPSHITLGINSCRAKPIANSIKKELEYIAINITDTGIGIPHDKLDRIFERFYVVDKSRSGSLVGTGLGLSIVKHIVNLHQGLINVTSQINEGTTFHIRLPVPESIDFDRLR